MYYKNHPYKPTLAHKFIKELEQKDQLLYIFTQNIDTLEKESGISPEKIVECHGSMDKTKCTGCGALGEITKFKDFIMNMSDGSEIICNKCKGLVKPDVVFFGEDLPNRFHTLQGNIRKSDLIIIIGTSLQVFPVAGMIYDVKQGTPIIVINNELPEMTRNVDDQQLIFIEGNIEQSIKKIAKDLNWNEFLSQEKKNLL